MALSSPDGLAFVLKDSLLEFFAAVDRIFGHGDTHSHGGGEGGGEGEGANVKGCLLHQHHPQVTKELFREMRSKEVFVF